MPEFLRGAQGINERTGAMNKVLTAEAKKSSLDQQAGTDIISAEIVKTP